MGAGLKVVSSCMLSRWGVMTVIRSYPDGELTVICFVLRGVMEITLGCVEETCIKVHDIQRYSCPRETKHPPIYPHHFPPEKPEQISRCSHQPSPSSSRSSRPSQPTPSLANPTQHGIGTSPSPSPLPSHHNNQHQLTPPPPRSCKPACGHSGSGGSYNRTTMIGAPQTCDINNTPFSISAGLAAAPGCGQSGNAYLCDTYAPIIASDALSYGFAILRDKAACCKCFELTWKAGSPAAGKKMQVQAINVGVSSVLFLFLFFSWSRGLRVPRCRMSGSRGCMQGVLTGDVTTGRQDDERSQRCHHLHARRRRRARV